jgi:acetylglutamate kinase
MPTTVVKLGGSALEGAEQVLAQLVGQDVVLVHGGGSAVSAMSTRLGLKPTFLDGLRVTDEATMDIAMMVQGLVNRRLVAGLARLGQPAYGLFGQDHGGWLRAEVLADGRYGRVGDVTRVQTVALDGPGIPVVAPVAVDDEMRALNVNADHVAAAVAAALGAERLVFITDVDAIRGRRGNLDEVGCSDLAGLIEDGTVAGGMLPKAKACLGAIARGVRCVSVGRGLTGGTRVWA